MVGTARRRQDDARPPAAGDPAAADDGGGDRDHEGPGRRGSCSRRPCGGAAVPCAAPHDLAVGPHRRQRSAEAGRDHARAPGRALPRRASGVRPRGARGAAPAARGGLRDGGPRPARGHVSRRDAMLVAACNGCPCARPAPQCTCNDVDRIRYARRLSGPLLDRIDIVCELGQPPPPELVKGTVRGESSAQVRERVAAARRVQAERPPGEPDPRIGGSGADRARDISQGAVRTGSFGSHARSRTLRAVRRSAGSISRRRSATG